MTEVRETSSYKGLFAALPFAVGDVILQENEPLVRLAPIDEEQEERIREAHVVGNRKNDSTSSVVTATSPSLWDSICAPSQLTKPEEVGAFKGMVQAALCFVDLSSCGLGDDTRKQLLELYHPALSDININSRNMNEEESKAVAISKLALDYLEQYCGLMLDTILPKDHHARETIQCVMLIWACNAFQGGRIYDRTSRINHSCNPNAVVEVVTTKIGKGSINNKYEDSQCIRAATAISAGDEITISYLPGLMIYSDTYTRRNVLAASKHFDCRCSRCCRDDDPASHVPCPVCHPRSQQHQLEEDVQYDDEDTVQYISSTSLLQVQLGMPTTAADTNVVVCEKCQTRFDSKDDSTYRPLLKVIKLVNLKVVAFLGNHPNNNPNNNDNHDDEEDNQLELLQQQLEMASSVLGTRHWTTNVLLFLHLDDTLKRLHTSMLMEQQEGQQSVTLPSSNDIALAIDSLQRLVRFHDRLGLHMHRGHWLAHVIIGVARALVSLGDTKSQKYAAEWLDKIGNDDNNTDNYVRHFESEGIQKVVSSLKVAWQRDDVDATQNDAKRAKVK